MIDTFLQEGSEDGGQFLILSRDGDGNSWQPAHLRTDFTYALRVSLTRRVDE